MWHFYRVFMYNTCFAVWIVYLVFFTVKSAKLGLGWYEGWKFNSGNYLFTTDTK